MLHLHLAEERGGPKRTVAGGQHRATGGGSRFESQFVESDGGNGGEVERLRQQVRELKHSLANLAAA